ncbi:hypothetical protein [Elioraea sp.]|uniref:hypothetical protein n=1 Tax=Elioraea sp. TaxID=2185103 RepID=UPI0021DBE52E|nr:hypothetical protein [Elioraea sp.]GIX10330.1 MAG: hypothetical protein KatS3mg116_2040 [Elioraea sp.]
MAVSIERQIACVEREIRMRRRAYPRWVSQGRMPQEKADAEIAEMEAVLATLRGLKAEVEPVML